MSRTKFAIVYGFSEFGGRGLLLVAQALVARLLGPREFGEFAPSLVYGGILWVVIELGHDRLLVKRTAEAPGETGPLHAAVSLRAGIGIVLVAATAAMSFAGFTSPAAIGMAVWAASEGVVRAYRLWLLGQNRPASDTVIHLSQRTITVLAVAIVARSPTSAGFAYALGNVATLVLLSLAGYYRWQKPTRQALRRLTSGSLPLFAASLFSVTFAQSDVLLLAALTGDDLGVGLYRAASQIQVAAVLPAQVLALGALSYFSSRPDAGWRTTRGILLPLVTAGIAACAAILVGLDALMHVVFGPNYGAPPQLTLFMGATTLLAYGTWGFQTMLVRRRRERAVMISTLVGLCIAVISNIVMTPQLGYLGAAVSRSLAELGMLAALAYSALRSSSSRGAETP